MLILTLNLKLLRKSESLRGERGEEGFEERIGLGLFVDALGVVILH